MRQAISQAASNAILDWRDAETVSLLEFPLKVVPGNQHGADFHKRPEVVTFQAQIEEIAREQLAEKAPDAHLGVRIIIVCQNRKWDLDNVHKSILDGLKQVAFGDDKVFDYNETVRIRAEKPDDVCFAVEILRLTDKRGSGWL